MTNEQINIAIAEACGWRFDRDEGGPYHNAGHHILKAGLKRGFKPDFQTWESTWLAFSIPDYCHDLNAMAEAEGKGMATIGEMGAYISALQPIMEREQWGWPDFKELIRQGADTIAYGLSPYIRATAHQRAEAFLRVKGLWKEKV